jgi:Raf kinase inhibitor-like YbhB/YbcL family protein
LDKIKVTLEFEKFPARHTCEGENLSPGIRIEGGRGELMALIMDDPDAPGGTWVHWVAWNLPLLNDIPEGIDKEKELERPFPAFQGTNSGDEIGYDGPCPPRGHGPHRYFFKVHVLGHRLDLRPGATKMELENAMEGKVVQYGEAMATFERR